MTTSLAEKVIDANIEVHSKLAAHYKTCEPHFRPENVAKVTERFAAVARETAAENVLDLGCGTGFMIDIAKPFVRRIVGVDVTQAMLDRIDRSGPAAIESVKHDTGSFPVDEGGFQVVTAYSFLHHLADINPTLSTAARALVPGGKFYADLDPNFYFWQSISALERGGDYDAVIRREIEGVTYKDEEIEAKFGVSREVFNHAEFGKDLAGGFKEEDLERQLMEAGFSQVDFHYHWFLGEAAVINSGSSPKEELLARARFINDALQRALPVSRNLFKYIGFVATR
jgi:ubiquinone/menaquinone biosynthesis C-methylase UbiE